MCVNGVNWWYIREMISMIYYIVDKFVILLIYFDFRKKLSKYYDYDVKKNI